MSAIYLYFWHFDGDFSINYTMNKLWKNLGVGAVAIVVVAFFANPTRYMQCFFDGLAVWAHNVLPALFPFSLLGALLTNTQKAPKKCGLFGKLFNAQNCTQLFVLNLLCGYPVGAKLVSQHTTDKRLALKLFSFCSSASPVFLIVTIGANLLRNTTATIVLVASHVLSVVANGLLHRNDKTTKLTFNFNLQQDFSQSLTNTVLSMLSVGSLVALFFMLTSIVEDLLPSTLTRNNFFRFAVGLCEMTNGAIAICQNNDVFVSTVLVCAIVSFGGLCVLLQSYAFLCKCKVSLWEMTKIKATQSAFATLFCFVLALIFL